MTGPAGIVASNYDFQRRDADAEKTISFRRVEMERDLGRLHRWLNEPHVLPYWRWNDPLPEFRTKLADKLADDHQTLYVGHLDHVPMSYWESYWAAEDDLAEHYDVQPADQGIHLLIGVPEFLGHGYAKPLLRAMTAFQFRHDETDRIVTEPDARNERVIRVFEACGFDPRRELAFDEKNALLMVCERGRFESEVLGR